MIILYPLSALLIISLMSVVLFQLVNANYNVYDKLLCVGACTSYVVILILLIGSTFGITHFIDLAIAYALLNFVFMLAFFKICSREKD